MKQWLTTPKVCDRCVTKMGFDEDIPKIHYTPNESITLSFHKMKMTLDWRQAIVSISNDLFLPSRFCDKIAPTPFIDQSTSKMNGLLHSGLTKISASTSLLFNAIKVVWHMGVRRNLHFFC